MKKYFFGWTNIKYLIVELIKIYSNTESFFSKKRLESGFSFFAAQTGLLVFLFKHMNAMTIMDIVAWAAVELGIAGYTVSQIQKEKKINNATDTSKDENPLNS